jgi:hypothetical protein
MTEADNATESAEREVQVYRVRYALCTDCDCVTIIQRNDDRGVPDESEWSEFGQCLVCGGSLHGWDADEKSLDDSYWAMGHAAGKRWVRERLDKALEDSGVTNSDGTFADVEYVWTAVAEDEPRKGGA